MTTQKTLFTVIVAFITIFTSTNTNAEEIRLSNSYSSLLSDSAPLPPVAHGLGFAAGPISGVGLSYKVLFHKTIALQVAGGYYSDGDDFRWALPGAEIQWILSREGKLAFYTCAAVSYDYERDVDYDYLYNPLDGNWSDVEDVEVTERTCAGAGIGLELLLLNRLSLTTEGVYYYRTDETAGFLLQVGLHYYVNTTRR